MSLRDSNQSKKPRVGLIHGTGYTGRTLISCLLAHPDVELTAVASRSQAGNRISSVHPSLRGHTDLSMCAPEDIEKMDLDVIFLAGEHGAGIEQTVRILDSGFDGVLVDLSADFRLKNMADYDTYYSLEHPRPDLLETFVYGLPELKKDHVTGAKRIANPGCFATGLTLALAPVVEAIPDLQFHGTVLTGASGSGKRAKSTTHFPDRSGNVRAYSVFRHRHNAEIFQSLGDRFSLNWIPSSGPWTHGIWGTLQATLPGNVSLTDISSLFDTKYADKPLVHLSTGELPELLHTVQSPFIDLGWIVQDNELVIGFALDNLWKGAASQAIQNMNLALGWPDTLGLMKSWQSEHQTIPSQ